MYFYKRFFDDWKVIAKMQFINYSLCYSKDKYTLRFEGEIMVRVYLNNDTQYEYIDYYSASSKKGFYYTARIKTKGIETAEAVAKLQFNDVIISDVKKPLSREQNKIIAAKLDNRKSFDVFIQTINQEVHVLFNERSR